MTAEVSVVDVVPGRPNVLVRLPGREPGKAVLISGHYDSVPTSPGAYDCANCVATLLEALRAVKAGPQQIRAVVWDRQADGGGSASEFLSRLQGCAWTLPQVLSQHRLVLSRDPSQLTVPGFCRIHARTVLWFFSTYPPTVAYRQVLSGGNWRVGWPTFSPSTVEH